MRKKKKVDKSSKKVKQNKFYGDEINSAIVVIKATHIIPGATSLFDKKLSCPFKNCKDSFDDYGTMKRQFFSKCHKEQYAKKEEDKLPIYVIGITNLTMRMKHIYLPLL